LPHLRQPQQAAVERRGVVEGPLPLVAVAAEVLVPRAPLRILRTLAFGAAPKRTTAALARSPRSSAVSARSATTTLLTAPRTQPQGPSESRYPKVLGISWHANADLQQVPQPPQ